MIRPDIKAIGAKWITAFRLQGLRIAIGYVRNLVNPFTGAPVYALMTELNGDEGSYKIEVQDPDTWPKGADRPPTEKTFNNAVRHEALHIRVRDFAKSNPSEADIIAEERAVWAISDAFDLIAENSAPRVAAMVVPLLAQGPKHFSNVAALVRAMAVQPAATRRQTKGNAMDDNAMLATLKLIQAASSPEEKEKLLDAAIAQMESKGGGGTEPASEPAPMPQGTGDGMEPEKDKMPMGGYDPKMAKSMQVELGKIRAMTAEIAQYRDEAKVAADMLRPKAKEELVRAMRADGVELTKAAEDQILLAPSLEVAKERAAGMRAMYTGGAPRKPAQQRQAASGLTPEQQKEYERIARTNPNRAEMFAAQCAKGGDK